MNDAEEIRARLKSLPAGALINGKYRVVQPLGAGGMGVVYHCVHELIDKEVALKILMSSDPALMARFVREAKAAARLKERDAAFVEVFDFGVHEGHTFLVMELLRGASLLDRVHRGDLPLGRLLEILIASCRALAVAHAAGIVHRDLKPENLFIENDGRCRILDLGIAKFSQPGDELRTGTHALLGTPMFMSPEQCRGTRIDFRSDLYSMGVVAYYLFAGGRMPFTVGDGQYDWIMAHVRDQPIPLSHYAPALPPGLHAAVHRLLEKEPADRFQSMTEAAEAFAYFLPREAELGGRMITTKDLAPAVAPPSLSSSLAKGEVSSPALAPPPQQRNGRLPVALLALALAGSGGYLALGPRHHEPVPRARPTAPEPIVAPAAEAAPPPAAPPAAAPLRAEAPAAARTGLLSVSVLPFAEVTVDGKRVGSTPVRALALKPGLHVVGIVNAGLDRRQTRTVKIEAGRHLRIPIDWSN